MLDYGWLTDEPAMPPTLLQRPFRPFQGAFALLTGVLLPVCCGLWTGTAAAASVSREQALAVAAAWAGLSPEAMHHVHGSVAGTVTAVRDARGQTDFYAVDLAPSGYVVISADDTVEPVIAFSTTDTFHATPGHPLYDMLLADLPARISRARAARAAAHPKWRRLQAIVAGAAAAGPLTGGGGGSTAAVGSVSDVRVAPLIQSKWDQLTAYSLPVYNYYTPPYSAGNVNNYCTGCVATMLGQIMRYYQWPQTGVGASQFSITVNHSTQSRALRGGDGAGGPYVWSSMPLVAASGMPVGQQQEIGDLLADAGVASDMDYEHGGSSAYLQASVLTGVFNYAGAAYSGASLTALDTAMQANLDAGMPVGLGISGGGVGHAVIADGYGYNGSTLYHHLNMGWSGADDSWYNLPTITAGGYDFNVVEGALFNISPSAAGEVLSGRIVDDAGHPVQGTTVTIAAGSLIYTATTNAEGIYAQNGLASSTRWTVTPSAGPRTFTPASLTATTGHSSANGGVGDVTNVNFASTVLTGAVSVQIDAEAAAAGAEWRVNGGSWQPSGALVNGVPIGTGSLTFRGAGVWNAPPPLQVPVTLGETTGTSVNFLPKYALAAAPDNAAYGSVSANPLPGDVGSYPYKSSVTLTATAAAGYYFAGWLENGVLTSTSASYVSTVTSARTLIAEFPPVTLTGSNTQEYVTSNRATDTIDVLADLSVTSGAPVILSVTQPAHGTVVINPDGTLTFTPNAGFHGYTQFSYTAGDGQGGELTETVTITNWFAASAGNYAGLSLAAGLTNESSGYLKATVAPSGAFTARLTVAGIAYPFAGAFDQYADYQKAIPRPGQSDLEVSLHLDAAADISGTISDGATASTLLANRLVFGRALAAPQAGRYAALVSDNNSVPGFGRLLVTVAPGGTVTAAGLLADNTPVSTGACLNADGSIPFYTGVNRTGSLAGSFFGVLTLAPGSTPQCTGTYAWFHPASSAYPNGFAENGALTGSRIPTPSRPSGIETPPPIPISAQLSGGNLTSTYQETGEILPNGTVVWTAPGSEELKLTINASDQVTGSFIDPSTGKRYPVQGVWLPDQSLGGGFFLDGGPGVLTLGE